MTDRTLLEQAIITYNEAYRNGNSLISDGEYDTLIDSLREKFPDSNLLKRSVIERSKESRKKKLPIPMYSLNKAKSNDEITKWMESKDLPIRTMLVITPKYDGISLVVNEKTKECWTRGDGEVGQISTDHFSKMNRSEFEENECFFSYGEAIMSRKNFEKYKDKYANPRNMVAGLFNRDIPVDELNDVDYIRYGASLNEDKNYQLEILDTLNKVYVQKYLCRFYYLTKELLEELYAKWSADYQIDGLVIDVCDKELRKSLGREENMNPAYAIAYKNPEWSSSAKVNVTGVEWKVSKQGKLKPVIQIEPTEVAGVTISNVTGYNAKYIFDNNIATGSVIKIVRSGDVIPKHIQTLSWIRTVSERLSSEINECPCCGMQLKWDETATELICSNLDCKDQKIAKLVHFFNTLEIEDFGEPSIIKLYDAGYDTIEKILALDYHALPKIEGFGLKSAEKLFKQFHQLKMIGISFAKFIHALDLMGGKIGEKTIQLIFDNTDPNEGDWVREDRLTSINGIAETTAITFIIGMSEYWMKNFNDSILVRISYIKSPKQEVIGDKYKGQRICFTSCRPSKELRSEIESQSGEVVDGVSKNTTLLVVKDASEKTMKSSKAVKAKELGIKIVTLNQL